MQPYLKIIAANRLKTESLVLGFLSAVSVGGFSQCCELRGQCIPLSDCFDLVQAFFFSFFHSHTKPQLSGATSPPGYSLFHTSCALQADRPPPPQPTLVSIRKLGIRTTGKSTHMCAGKWSWCLVLCICPTAHFPQQLRSLTGSRPAEFATWMDFIAFGTNLVIAVCTPVTFAVHLLQISLYIYSILSISIYSILSL